MKISELSVRRPVLMTMVYVLIAIIAVVYLMNIEIALYPETDMPMISVMTSCDGADSELVEQQVTRQLEDALSSVENLESMTRRFARIREPHRINMMKRGTILGFHELKEACG